MATNQMRREAAKRKLASQQQRRAERARRRQRVAIITSAAVVVVVVVGVVVLSTIGTGGGGAQPAAAPAPATGAPASIPTDIVPLPTRPTALPATVTCDYPAGEQASKPVQPPAGADISATGTVPVTLQTSAGTVPLTLDRALAPCAVNSFVSLAQQGYFNDTGCHRLTTSDGLQVLQCGDPSGTGSGGPGYTFNDEVFPELTYGRGILAMANAGANTNGSQFFMVYGNAQLPPNYTVFGSISPDGLQVLDAIARAGQNDANGTGDGAPNSPVTIQTATVG
ncbi:peptidylprolyl isomerase [Pseudonocardia aurantiaca]|uniref:Peptidyl-prolyl cis-trans isomerase n=1 Tax=Pseudonocardia aurantiaca TaxID=75290 RepID=A0ABW4FXZ4_9PSEU